MKVALISTLLLASMVGQVLAENWPAWRGPEGTGVTAETDLPLEWSRDKNVAWRIELPDKGNSTPIIWEDRVFLNQAIESEKRRTLMCLDRTTGKLLWQSGVAYKDEDPTHPTNPYNSASPVTDGERVIAWFGSAGVYCYDFAGKELWHRELGPIGHEWGNGSSPVLEGDLCIINFGPGDPSYVVALDKRTGSEVWRIPVPHERTEEGPTGLGENGDAKDKVLFGSWSTPLVIEVDGQRQLILSLPGKVIGCDPQTGREIWSCRGMADLVYSSPAWGDGVLVVMGGFHGACLAVRPQGTGDITATQRLWHQPRSKLRLGTGVVHEGYFYHTDMKGIAECLELETGKQMWEKRLSGRGGKNDTWSSMVKSGDRIYLLNQSGDMFVLRANPKKLEVLATNALDEETNSSVAVSDGQLFIRTHNSLWCIGAK